MILKILFSPLKNYGILLPKLYPKFPVTGYRNFFFQRCYCNGSSIHKDLEPEALEYLKKLEETKKVKRYRARTMFNYLGALVIFMGGAAFAFIPFFNAFCRVTEFANQDQFEASRERTKNLKPVHDMVLRISFNADKSSYLNWKFQPLQNEITVSPGETVLAFYSAENPSDRAISGISTYNVVPYEAAKYFNKIQCFCFDEQRLNPHEHVDMPVFFYIDPDIVKDPYLYGLQNITLSYTFFEAIPGLDLPFMSSFVEEDV